MRRARGYHFRHPDSCVWFPAPFHELGAWLRDNPNGGSVVELCRLARRSSVSDAGEIDHFVQQAHLRMMIEDVERRGMRSQTCVWFRPDLPRGRPKHMFYNLEARADKQGIVHWRLSLQHDEYHLPEFM